MSQKHAMAINNAYFTSNNAVGGNHPGASFYFGVDGDNKVPASGVSVRSLQFWYNPDTIRGLRVKFTDGNALEAGVLEETATDEFYIADGEKIQSLQIWSTDLLGGRCGRIKLTTDRKRSLEVDVRNSVGDPYEPDIGSGILMGVFGESGADIDCLGFAILRHIEAAKLINVKYPTLDQKTVYTKPESVESMSYDNSKGSVQQTFTFEGSTKFIESQSWSMTASLEYTVSATVEAEIPFVASVSATSSLTLGASATYQRESTKEVVESFSWPVNVPANTIVQAIATKYTGFYSLPYTGKMVYKLDSGEDFTYEMHGVYNGVSVSKVALKTETNSLL